ncbi:hypothetical protein [Streptomyces sp. KL116D]|uniref:hypothetical protein n=1 Tax=Streptomyces sp. KL116D TaxID=3045152 RepID=UPI00355934BA
MAESAKYDYLSDPRYVELSRRAHQAEGDAELHQMDADVYGRPGRDYTDTARADQAGARAESQRAKGRDLRTQADAVKTELQPKPKKKSSWW